MSFSTSLGNGGVVAAFGSIQTEGTLYNAYYQEVLTAQAESGLPGVQDSVAMSQGLFANSLANKPVVYQKIKEVVFRNEDDSYTFRKRFFINTTMTPNEVLDLLKTGDIATFMSDANTVELDSVNDAVLLSKII